MKKLALLVAGAGLWVLALLLVTNSSSVANTDGSGSIKGIAKFDGNLPEPQKKKPDVDVEACGKDDITLEKLIVDKSTKGIKNVYIEVDKATEFKWDGKTVYEFDQKGCIFTPHILVVPVGAKVDLKNSDSVLHNVKSTSLLNGSFNEGIQANGMITKQFKMAEKVKVECSVHSWMSGWIIVTKNGSYALTDDKGSYEIKGIPPGKYKVKVWHEILGTQEKEVEIKSDGTAEVNFELKAK